MTRWLAVAALVVPLAAKGEEAMSSTVTAAPANPDGAAASTVSTDSFAGESKHVGDIVALSPGTNVLDYGGVLAAASVSVRGASSDEVQVVFNGIPLNASVGGGFDLSLIPAALVDSVEVRRGSEGSNIGAGAMGGAVVLEPVVRSRALITYGSWNTYGASVSWASPQAAAWHVLAAADYRHTDGDFQYQRSAVPELPDSPLYTLTRTNNDATIGSTLVRLDREMNGGRLSGLLLLGVTDRGLPGAIYSVTPTSRQLEGDGLMDLRWESKGEGGSSATIPLTVKGGVVEATGGGPGFSNGIERVIDVATRPVITAKFGHWTIETQSLIGIEGLTGSQIGGHERIRAALGMNASVVAGAWTGSAALRGEYWGNAGAVLPRVGGTVRLVPGVTLAANVGTGFRPPSFSELYYSSGPVVPNPNLLPETSLSADLGVHLHFGHFFGSVTGFAGEYRNLIVYELFNSFAAKPENIGDAMSYGGELEIRWKPTVWWTGCELYASGTEIVTRNLVQGPDTFGLEIPYRPQHKGVVRADVRKWRWRAAVEAQATSIAFINESNTRWVPAYVDLGGSLGVRVWRDFWAGGEIRNALGTLNRMNVDGYPLPGRMFLANVSWEPASEEAP